MTPMTMKTETMDTLDKHHRLAAEVRFLLHNGGAGPNLSQLKRCDVMLREMAGLPPEQANDPKEMRETLAKIPVECDSMPLKQILSLSAPCDVIEEMTHRMAGWPSPNEKLTDGGPVSNDCNQKPNPPFGAATC